MTETRIEKPVIYRTTLPEIKDYYAPNALEEALELLDKYKENAVIYAGGTDLVIGLRLANLKDKIIIDIKRIKELHKIEYIDGKGLAIGPTMTIAELLEEPIIKQKYKLLWETMKNFADYTLRQRATIGGNICNASPAADTPLALLVYNAAITIKSKEGERTVPIKELFTGVKKTVLKPNEMVTAIHLPEPPENAKTMYLRYVRTSEDLMVTAIAGLAANILEPEKRIVKLAYGAVAPTPLLIEEVETIFKQTKPVKELIEEAIKTVMNKVSPITDVRATREYRLHLVEYGTRYLLKTLLEVQ